MIKRSLPYIFVATFVLVAIFLRFYKLEQIPTIISHDEIYYVAQAKTIQLANTDPAGKWSPFSLSPAHPLFAELPGTVFSIGNFIIPNNPILAQRIISSSLSIALALSLSLLCFQFTKNKNLSGVVLTIALFNPWSFQMARMAFDAPLSLVFYFIGMNLFFSKKKWMALLSLPIFILGFYQYQGLKLIFPFLLALMLIVMFIKDRPKKINLPNFFHAKKWHLISLLILLIFFGSHLVRLQSQKVQSRLSDTIFSENNVQVKNSVAMDRAHTFSSPLTRYIINDQTTKLSIFSEKYLASYNLNNLFYKLEQLRNPFAVQSHGLFYLVDLPLIIYGALGLRKKNKPLLALLLGLLLIAPFPAAINTNDTWTLFRASLMYPPLIILSASGLYYLATRVKNGGRYIFVTILLIYALLAIRFFFIFFYQYPVTASENYYFAERIISNYVLRQQNLNTNSITIHANEADFLYYEVLVHNKSITNNSLSQIFESFEKGDTFTIGTATMNTSCINNEEIARGDTIITDSSVQPCDGAIPDTQKDYIKSFRDAGTYFIIYNDQLCADVSLDSYPRISKKILSVEALTNDDFCKTLISSDNI